MSERTNLKVIHDQSEAASFAPVDETGRPMIQISCAATELVPTRQYANVTVGPIVVKVWIPINFNGFNDEEVSSIKRATKEVQEICEDAVADERKTLHNLISQSTNGK